MKVLSLLVVGALSKVLLTPPWSVLRDNVAQNDKAREVPLMCNFPRSY